MRCRLALALVAAFAAQNPATESGKQLTLELRVFQAIEEVTAQTRATVHRAGDRGEPLMHVSATDGRIEVRLPAGIYDVQAIHERDGRVVNIRWANRLVLMPYPDEPGHHLEVINFSNGFGALQIREPAGARPDASLYEPGKREKPITPALPTPTYLLFVVRAGSYDLLSRSPGKSTWYPGVDVPLDRTRLWISP